MARMGMSLEKIGVAGEFVVSGFSTPASSTREFSTVEFNALPHHSPCAVLVTSDRCHLYARTGRNHSGTPGPVGTVFSSNRLTRNVLADHRLRHHRPSIQSPE